MATLQLDESGAVYMVRSYEPGKLQINEKLYTQSLILSQDQLITDWQPQSVNDLTSDSFRPVFHFNPDILLIGTGSTLAFLSANLYGDLINAGIGVEVMNTRSACFTFNALASEGRKVVAALIIK